MRFDDMTKEMYLGGCYPGIDPQEVVDHMQFSVDVSRAREVTPPTAEELKTMREICDPQRLIL